MKILFVDQSGELGGGELSLLDIIKGLPHSSRVLLFSDGPFRQQLEQIGVPVNAVSAGRLSGVRSKPSATAILSAIPAIQSLRAHVKDLAKQSDVIYANSQKAFIISALSSRNRNKKLVWHLRDILTSNHFNPHLRRFAVWLANRRVSAVIANSKATRDAFVELGGDSTRVHVVHNGIDASDFEAVHNDDVRQLRESVAPGADFVVGLFGRISPWKGQHILLEALHALPGVHAVIVGEALFGEAEYADTVRRKAQDPDLLGRVHFLGFRRDIPELMKAMDVIVHASTAPEPFGRVLVEGMLAERPVIATRAGGALEIIKDGETGILTPPGNSAELGNAIAHLQNNPVFGAQIASSGHDAAKAYFSLDAMLNGVQQVIAQV